MYQALERYLQKHGTARVPQSYVTEEGVKLGIWLNKVRMEYKWDACHRRDRPS